jgi:hypothetical protein
MQLEHVGPLLVVEPESSSEIGDLGGGQVRSGRRCRRRGRGAYGGANHCGAVQEKKRNTGGRNLRKKAGISHLHCTWVLPSPPLPSPARHRQSAETRRRRGIGLEEWECRREAERKIPPFPPRPHLLQSPPPAAAAAGLLITRLFNH